MRRPGRALLNLLTGLIEGDRYPMSPRIKMLALSEYGISHLDMPATPERVWQAIAQSRTG
jgi:hypothetical protein